MWINETRTLSIFVAKVDIPAGAFISLHFPSVATPSSQRPSAQATLATTDRAGATIDTAVFTISAVQPGSISGTWASKNGVPGIASDVNVELTSSGAISAGGALEIVLPSSHGWSFLTDYPAISFVQPSSVIANASWKTTSLDLPRNRGMVSGERENIEIFRNGPSRITRHVT